MKTIIVGGGINGLLLGALLSKELDQLIIFEKKGTLGGRAMLHERDGFVIDFGLHVTRLGPASPVAKVMRRIGKSISYRKMGKSYLIDHDGNKVTFPSSPLGFFTCSLFTWYEKIKIVPLILAVKRGKYNELTNTTVQEWLDENSIQGGIRRFFEMLSTSMMVCPFIDKTSAGEMFRVLQTMFEIGHTIEYPAQGWKPIYSALIEAIEKQGSIKLESEVQSVIIKSGKAVGVVVDGKEYLADRIVINLPVQQLFTVLDEELFSKEYVELCKNLVPTSGVFVDVALGKRISDMDGLLYTYHPKTIGMITSNVADGIAPAGKQLLTFWYPTLLQDVTDPENLAKRKAELWKAIKAFFPDIEKHIVWKRETALRMVDGAQVNINQTEDKRPKSKVPGIENLFLVGDSIAAPGGGGDIGNESVLLTFKEMTGKTCD